MSEEPKKSGHVSVDGIVSRRDKRPYVRLFLNDHNTAQLSIAQARAFAMDILQMCSRTEADAMILKFFEKEEFPDGAAMAIMVAFRDFRLGLDEEPVERSVYDPESGGEPKP